MNRHPPRSTRTYTLCPYTPLFRSRHGNWRSSDIPGRILLARALYAGFGGADAEFPAMGGLVSAERLARARQWGLAIRLAQRLTGGVEAPLKASGKIGRAHV